MQEIKNFKTKIKVLFSDIDDTMTDHGKLTAEAYQALWNLQAAGIELVPITGRPAGYCEMIARFWPVRGVVGENGSFYFSYRNRKMKRYFFDSAEVAAKNLSRLKEIGAQVLKKFPAAQASSDQFCRLTDFSVDFCEDVDPLPMSDVKLIAESFIKQGAQAKISSIHVNAYFGTYDKLKMCQCFVEMELGQNWQEAQQSMAFVGDSPNDEPMFGGFKNSFAVANIKKFADELNHKPHFVLSKEGGRGFCELAEHLIQLAKK